MNSSRVRSKRRKLMPLYVSPPRPDLPAIFESLNDDTLTTVLEFIGNKSYRSFGGLNKQCKEVYLATKGMTKETFLYGYAPLSIIKDKIIERDEGIDLKLHVRTGKGVVYYNRRDVLAWAVEWALEERKSSLLRRIFYVAVEEGRIDLLQEVLNDVNNEDDKRYVFYLVDIFAARSGKLNVLKWLEIKGLRIDEAWCAKMAAQHGHLHIIQWLQEEKGLVLSGELYYEATNDGGQLHVMKWLRDQKVPWDEIAFNYAALEGNLEVLQWLHDEGCPWPDDDYLRVREEDLEPEVIEWLRTNGYGDRIQLLL